MKCPVCHEPLENRENFCPICGHKITEKERFAYAEKLMEHPELAEAPDFENDYEPIQKPVGSWFGGILLGLFLNIIGVVIAIATRGRNTKRGAGISFLISALLYVIWFFLLTFWISYYFVN